MNLEREKGGSCGKAVRFTLRVSIPVGPAIVDFKLSFEAAK